MNERLGQNMAVRTAGPVLASAPGKVNTYLAVGPPEDDGYHPLTSIFMAISLREWVELRPTEGTFLDEGVRSVKTVGYSLPADGGDPVFDAALTEDLADLDPDIHLAARAVRAVFEEGAGHANLGLLPAVDVVVHKTIPVAGGMAGGSADAAAALVAANKILKSTLPKESASSRAGLSRAGLSRAGVSRAGLSPAELEVLGASLGADVPACLVGGLALGLGRGDEMRLLTPGSEKPQPTSWWWVARVAQTGLSTPEVFSVFDTLNCRRVTGGGAEEVGPRSEYADEPAPTVPGKTMNDDDLSLLVGDAQAGVHGLRNDLTGAAYRLQPALAKAHGAMIGAGALEVLLSGSGPTLVGVTETKDSAARVSEQLSVLPGTREAFPMWGPAIGAQTEQFLPSWCVET